MKGSLICPAKFGALAAVAARQRQKPLHALQMAGRGGVAPGHELGQGQHQGVACLDQVGVTVRQVAFQLSIDGKHVAIEQVGTVLGFFQTQGRLGLALNLHQRKRLVQVVVGAGVKELGQFVGRGRAGEHDDLEVRTRGRRSHALEHFQVVAGA